MSVLLLLLSLPLLVLLLSLPRMVMRLQASAPNVQRILLGSCRRCLILKVKSFRFRRSADDLMLLAP
jgi:hypothetical protein